MDRVVGFSCKKRGWCPSCVGRRMADDAAVWEKALRKLRGHLMPPPGMPQPPQKDADEFVAWLESTLDSHPAAQTLLAKAPATR